MAQRQTKTVKAIQPQPLPPQQVTQQQPQFQKQRAAVPNLQKQQLIREQEKQQSPVINYYTVEEKMAKKLAKKNTPQQHQPQPFKVAPIAKGPPIPPQPASVQHQPKNDQKQAASVGQEEREKQRQTTQHIQAKKEQRRRNFEALQEQARLARIAKKASKLQHQPQQQNVQQARKVADGVVNQQGVFWYPVAAPGSQQNGLNMLYQNGPAWVWTKAPGDSQTATLVASPSASKSTLQELSSGSTKTVAASSASSKSKQLSSGGKANDSGKQGAYEKSGNGMILSSANNNTQQPQQAIPAPAYIPLSFIPLTSEEGEEKKSGLPLSLSLNFHTSTSEKGSGSKNDDDDEKHGEGEWQKFIQDPNAKCWITVFMLLSVILFLLVFGGALVHVVTHSITAKH